MKKTIYTLACIAVNFIGNTAYGATQAITPVVLSSLDSKQVFDPSTNLIWTSDWNLANGKMTWTDSMTWISSLNAANYAGHNDWRLPSSNASQSSPCHGTGCTGSEMGHMFYEVLGGHANQSVLTQTGDSQVEMDNLALFKNVQAAYYWSSTEYDATRAFGFGFSQGDQGWNDKTKTSVFAVAVRAVPEPRTYAMLLVGLGLIAGMARRGSLQ